MEDRLDYSEKVNKEMEKRANEISKKKAKKKMMYVPEVTEETNVYDQFKAQVRHRSLADICVI